LDPTALYAGISSLRRHVHRHPRDAYAWIDLARLYTILGQNVKAQRAMRTALALAPEDRFALRAAARYFVHTEEPDVAQHMLIKARSTRSDPWLISAEIAVSQVAHKKSHSAAAGQRALEQGQWDPHNSSELAGSLATLLLEDGSAQKARQLFRRSLQDPTENAVAQAQWATQRTSGLFVPSGLLEHPGMHEARALRERTEGQWDNVITSSWQWAEYEPTSSRSMIMGSYVAAVAFEDGVTVLEFTDRGLSAEPHNVFLLNNKAVGLAYLGQLPESAAVLRQVIIENSPESLQPALYATTGLLSFRQGDIVTGRVLYEKALRHRYTRRDNGVRILALWHLALEEVRAQTGQAQLAVARAERASKDVKLAEIGALRTRIEKTRALNGTQ
jgi:tetratricopeptide (TPR) repeat protein